MKLTSLGLACALALATLAAGCGGAAPHVIVNNDVAITITPALDELPFDPRGARLRSATDQLSRLAGHPIAIQVDAALVAAFRADFERQLIDAVERIARGLVSFRDQEPEAFARAAAALRRIECRYRATVDEPSGTFDASAGVLRVDLGAHPASLVPEGVVAEALAVEDDAFRSHTYAAKTPDTVAAAERGAYFEYLVRTRPGYGSLYERELRERDRALPPAESQATAHADVIVRVLRLNELAKAGYSELESKTHAWLMRQLDYFVNTAYRGRNVGLAALGPNTLFRAAEAGFGRWLARELPRASLEERLIAARKLYDVTTPDAFPGVDRFAFGLAIVDAWLRAGKPQTASADDPISKLFDEVVCPSVRDARGEHTRSRSCSSASVGWLAFAAGDDAHRRALAQALDARNDADLADQLFFALRGTFSRRSEREGKTDAFIALFHVLDPKLKSWRAALEVLALDRDWSLDDEAAYVWKTYPDRRGSALFLLAQSKRDYGSYNGDEYWSEFSKRFGRSVDGAILSSMLGHGRPAFEQTPKLWRALGPGFSRADAVVPHIDAVMPDATLPEATDVLRALSGITSRLCADKAVTDLAKLHAYLERRALARPADARALAILRRDTSPGGCRARTKD